MQWLPRLALICLAASYSLKLAAQAVAPPLASSLAKPGSWEQLAAEAQRVGKPAWRPMLAYVAHLHQQATHPAAPPFDYEWEDLGPGYVYGNAFGHWDVVHETLDVLPAYPEHALHQLLNDIKNQEPSGLIPGSIYMAGGLAKHDSVYWNHNTQGHPPLWPVAVQDYVRATGDSAVIKLFYTPLIRQITWFENTRRATNGGFFYNDILLKKWESGVDEGIRFDDRGQGGPGLHGCHQPRVPALPHGRAVGAPAGPRCDVLRPARPRLAGLHPNPAVCARYRYVL